MCLQDPSHQPWAFSSSCGLLTRSNQAAAKSRKKTKSTQTNTKTPSELFLSEIIKANDMMLLTSFNDKCML